MTGKNLGCIWTLANTVLMSSLGYGISTWQWWVALFISAAAFLHGYFTDRKEEKDNEAN